jgi:flagellar hook-length control protein FliK
MQTPNLQIPTLNANAVAAPKSNVSFGAGGDNDAFKQALSREMDQRSNNEASSAGSKQPARTAERPASRASAPKQQQAAAPAKQADTSNNEAEAPQPVAASEAATAPAPAKTASSDSESSSTDSASSDAQAAQSADPVADMLALGRVQPAGSTSRADHD